MLESQASQHSDLQTCESPPKNVATLPLATYIGSSTLNGSYTTGNLRTRRNGKHYSLSANI